MSRLIIKNLPEKIKESRLREIFSSKGGQITDVKLCFTKRGVFRKFAFIGYTSEGDAAKALNFFNKSFIDTSKIQVDVCKDLGDQSVPRPWSKYAKGSSAFSRKSNEIEDRKSRIKNLQEKESNKKKKSKKKVNAPETELQDVKDDPEFQEFLALHSNKLVKQTWTNENEAFKDSLEKKVEEDSDLTSNDDEVLEKGLSSPENENETDDEKDQEDQRDQKESNSTEEKPNSLKKQQSDLDWLKSKITKTKGETSDSDEKTLNLEEEHQRDQDSSSSSDEKEENDDAVATVETKQLISSLTLKMRGVPFTCSEKNVIDFFKPLKITDIRFQKNLKGKPTGYAFVDFESLKDAEKALKKDQNKIKGRYIELFMVHNKKCDEQLDSLKWNKKAKDDEDGDEDVSDTGRLFVRNLSYACTEDDLQHLFSKYGALVEVNLPIDKNSNKSTGYGFVTFMMPEHAVKAMSELDGSIFQGRILHLLPGKAQKSKDRIDNSGGGSEYKKKKESQQKILSGSSHNWNALFLGQNAVADVVASRLNANKRDLLDGGSSGSVAVRMALGETELVSDTRKFLESHGVKLDVFGQSNCARSKTTILVKNLPPGTTASELETIFSKYGDIGKVLIPPFGITAIIEFIQPKEAREAFTNLAYSKFKHTPLYLEWAPVDILTGEVTVKEEEEMSDNDSHTSGEESVTGNVVFVKNLNFTTTEEKLKERFSNCGKLKNVTIAKKKDPRKPGVMLSMGYGFVEYKKVESADKAIKLLQHCDVDGHKLELKKSHRESIAPKASRKRAVDKKQTSSKIIVRNIPFEATTKEIQELFSSFGHIKTVRLPKKMVGTGSHRGFAFVDFTTKQDANRAFKALCQSTHLYGRRLVLEWADDEDSVELLRQKTAQYYHEDPEPNTKRKKVDMLSSLEKSSVAE
ncbi:probable RNA-binding protein 19 isoform X2 [Hydractinia symbiolongicarpus]|uniref:probable RNA-binding protein 19 isoform X2 n=1 Tax=Hydractinia symbiolongicarpus TaxID=13093 RepID=UPI00254D60AC|nr:probable RNA-binding protein 19 isoform X2 [Hydractinia symbiolongicarpus]